MRASGRVVLAVGLSTLALAACGSGGASGTGATSGTGTKASLPGTGGPTQPGGGHLGPEGIPIERGPSLAPASTTAQGRAVDGVKCPPVEQLVYHIHSHLQVYVNGQPRQLPGAIGLVGAVAQRTRFGPVYGATTCYYYLHTHTADGIIHVESPLRRLFTLGNFFDMWGQHLSPDSVAGATGPVTAFVNGRRWTRSPRDIPLLPEEAIQLDVGKPVVAFRRFSFGQTGL